MPQLDLIRRIPKAAPATGAPSRAELSRERHGHVGICPTTANEGVIPSVSVATAWTKKLGGDHCTSERHRRILTRDRSITMSYAMNEDAAIELARRNAVRYIQSSCISHWEVDRLIRNLTVALPGEAFSSRARNAIVHGAPVIGRGSVIGCDVMGPIFLTNVHLRHGGLIYGCGAVLLIEQAHLLPGSVVHLRGGQVVATKADLEALVVGNLFHDPASLN